MHLSTDPSACKLCSIVKSGSQVKHERHIIDLKASTLFVGEHQFFSGYCVLIAHKHVREMHFLPAEIQQQLCADMMAANRAVFEAYSPEKLNLASLGNVEEHLHWHIIPRYADEEDCRDHPWKNSQAFSKSPTTALLAAAVRTRVLPLLGKET